MSIIDKYRVNFVQFGFHTHKTRSIQHFFPLLRVISFFLFFYFFFFKAAINILSRIPIKVNFSIFWSGKESMLLQSSLINVPFNLLQSFNHYFKVFCPFLSVLPFHIVTLIWKNNYFCRLLLAIFFFFVYFLFF